MQNIINENSIKEKGLIVTLNPHSLSIVHRDQVFADAKLCHYTFEICRGLFGTKETKVESMPESQFLEDNQIKAIDLVLVV